MKKSYEVDLCTGSVLKKMLGFAVPVILSSLLQLLFNAADVIVVGQFCGDNALAAVGSNGALVNLFVNLFLGVSVGSNVLAARYYGARENEKLRHVVHTSVTFSFWGGLVLTVVGFFGAKPLLIWMQTPEEVLPLATTYLRIYFLGTVASMLYNFGAAVLRGVGDTRRPMYFLVLAGAVNVVLNLFFVIVLHMGVAGVALATILSQVLSAGLVFQCLVRSEGDVRLDPSRLRVQKETLRELLRIGLPAGLQSMLYSIANVVIQSSVNSFGSEVMAGNAAASNIEGFVYVAMNAFFHTATAFVGQNYGAKQYRRIRKCIWMGFLCVTVAGTLLGTLANVFSRSLLQIYTEGETAIATGQERLRYIAGTYALCGIMEVEVGSLRGLGHSIPPMINAIMGSVVLRVGWILTFFRLPKFHTLPMLYITYPGSWVLTVIAHGACLIFFYRRERRKAAESAPLPTQIG